LAGRPALYLFDEPTAHLDTALRLALQEELAEQRIASGAAAVYATHDSGEALAIADRIALLRDGGIVQIGSPEEVYARPIDVWAALLTGPASVLHVDVAQPGHQEIVIRCDGRAVKVEGAAVATGWASVLVRPDWAELGGDLPGRVSHVWYRGPYTDYRLETTAGLVEIRRDGAPIARPGDRINWGLRRVWAVPEAGREQ
jgi:ABC-type Fe3+/spermidine/putrescine transport system ATPase subunit